MKFLLFKSDFDHVNDKKFKFTFLSRFSKWPIQEKKREKKRKGG